jgi:uncharacterized membrane protein
VPDVSRPRSPVITPLQRLLACAILGTVVAVVAAFVCPWQIAVLIGWNVSLALLVAWLWLRVAAMDANATRDSAMNNAFSHLVAEILVIAASVLNLVVVGSALVQATSQPVVGASLINGACVLSVALSWAVIHTVYAFRYARMYYERGGGIGFEDAPPDYRDFAYLSFTIGMTYQVSDTPFTLRDFRRAALGHMLLSYLFGAVIGATLINVVAGLFRG